MFIPLFSPTSKPTRARKLCLVERNEIKYQNVHEKLQVVQVWMVRKLVIVAAIVVVIIIETLISDKSSSGGNSDRNNERNSTPNQTSWNLCLDIY